MRVSFDTNVVLDILARADRYPESVIAYDVANLRGFDLLMPVSAVTDIAYILRRAGASRESVRESLSALMVMFSLHDVNCVDCKAAIGSPLEDFEDAFLAESAKRHEADMIMTRNQKDFLGSSVPVMTPKAFVDRFCPDDYSYDVVEI